MKKGLSILLVAAALFGFYGGAVNLNDVLACKDYWEKAGEESTANMNKLEDGLNQLKENEQAYLDALTGTYNRQYLNHILSAWISRGSGFAGAMLDLDNFKQINDAFGHSEGDAVLTAVADMLKRCRITNEWVYRFAGDEFIILRLTDDENGLADYMAEVERRLAEYNVGRPYPIALSYGVSYFNSGSIDAFMKDMDEKMYAMKERHHARQAAPEGSA